MAFHLSVLSVCSPAGVTSHSKGSCRHRALSPSSSAGAQHGPFFCCEVKLGCDELHSLSVANAYAPAAKTPFEIPSSRLPRNPRDGPEFTLPGPWVAAGVTALDVIGVQSRGTCCPVCRRSPCGRGHALLLLGSAPLYGHGVGCPCSWDGHLVFSPSSLLVRLCARVFLSLG